MEKTLHKYAFDNVYRNRIECGGFSLFQFGELWCNPDSSIPSHLQPCHEITYVIAGSGKITVGDAVYEVKEGQCVLSFPGENHAIEPNNKDPLRFAFIGFDQSAKNDCFGYLFEELGRLFFSTESRCVSLPDQNSFFVRLFSELRSNYHFRNEMGGYLIAEFLIDFIREGLCTRKDNYFPVITDRSVLVYGIENYLAKNIFTIKKLTDLETVFNYNSSYLAKNFFQVTQKHLKDYFIECKMKTANLLLQQGFSVTQISERLNYSSIHSFSRSYKQYYGISPSERKGKTDEGKN